MNMKHYDAKVNSVDFKYLTISNVHFSTFYCIHFQTLQNFIFSAIKDSNVVIAKSSLDLLCEMYNKNIWKCAKSVNIIASCCTSKHAKVNGVQRLKKVKDFFFINIIIYF